MLKTVQLYNFKSHPKTLFSFDDSRLHALVGPNSSGKTSVLQGLHYLSRLAGKDNSSFADIFQHESSPEFLTKTGEDSMSVIATGFWKVPQSIWIAFLIYPTPQRELRKHLGYLLRFGGLAKCRESDDFRIANPVWIA